MSLLPPLITLPCGTAVAPEHIVAITPVRADPKAPDGEPWVFEICTTAGDSVGRHRTEADARGTRKQVIRQWVQTRAQQLLCWRPNEAEDALPWEDRDCLVEKPLTPTEVHSDWGARWGVLVTWDDGAEVEWFNTQARAAQFAAAMASAPTAPAPETEA